MTKADVWKHCTGLTQFIKPYDKLYAIYVRAIADHDPSPVHPILAFITDCFGTTNHVYGISHCLDFTAFTDQVIETDSCMTLFFLLADELTDDQ